MTRMMYNWIMRRKLDPREDPNRGVRNFMGRVKGMHIFIGNFTYLLDFMIVEDISSIIDPRLSQVVLGKPFIEVSNMTHDLSSGVVRFMNRAEEIAYKIPYKIEQYDSLSDLKKGDTKSVYFMNEEDKRRGVDYVMSKILGFYKECLELEPEYLTGLEDEGGVTGGGLILYQAYGNLYAMTGRKAYLLEEKQIPSVGIFDEVSFYTLFPEVIHMTWAHLEKKQTRLQLYIKSFKETVHTERGDGVAITKQRRQDFHIDDVTDLATGSERSRLKVDLESLTWQWHQRFNM
ncbi:hypothetical protein Tco_0685713 [Tanacetum coccineum]